jgi:hypothetical protein
LLKKEEIHRSGFSLTSYNNKRNPQIRGKLSSLVSSWSRIITKCIIFLTTNLYFFVFLFYTVPLNVLLDLKYQKAEIWNIIFVSQSWNTCTVKPRFFAPRFTAKLAYRQEFLQSRFPYVVTAPLKCQTRIPPSATVIQDQTVNLPFFHSDIYLPWLLVYLPWLTGTSKITEVWHHWLALWSRFK